MYVRVLSFECRASVTPEDVSRVYHKLINAAEDADGFEGSTLLMSEESCRGLALMFWRDRDAASAAGPSLVELLKDDIYEMLEHPPDITGYVVMDDRIVSGKSR